jgi:ribose-phosphate pyrophosphokinase
VDRVIALEVHNPAAFANAFRCGADNLDAHAVFAAHLAPMLGVEEAVVLSPDTGGFKRAESFRQCLADALDRPVRLGMMEKWRSGGMIFGRTLFAKVAGCDVVIVDDLISSGTTMLRAAHAARDAGARAVYAVASHGLFTGGATVALNDPSLTRLVIGDSVPPFRLRGSGMLDRLDVLPMAPLFVQAIRPHQGEGVT